jgi:hypothetical protein
MSLRDPSVKNMEKIFNVLNNETVSHFSKDVNGKLCVGCRSVVWRLPVGQRVDNPLPSSCLQLHIGIVCTLLRFVALLDGSSPYHEPCVRNVRHTMHNEYFSVLHVFG